MSIISHDLIISLFMISYEIIQPTKSKLPVIATILTAFKIIMKQVTAPNIPVR
ncbi:MAG: hypothetical protein GY757_51380 [bacterium]|nr:hypothetical protein [bacterium]